MLLPMGPVQQFGPPSIYVLKMRPWMCLLLCFQSVMCLLRFFVVVDIIGGFVELITVCVGWWAWYKDMNVSFIIFWGLMCFINGIFDVAYLIDFWVHQPPLFGAQWPWRHNFKAAVHLCVPLVTLPGALVAYLIYRDMSRNAPAEPQGGGDWAQGGAWGSGQLQRDREDQQERTAFAYRGSTTSSGRTFQAFGGEGQRLGSS